MHECYYDAHTQAFKLTDVTNFQWKLIFYDDLASSTITCINRGSDGFFYVNKRWI